MILTVGNTKGGVGKTTLAINIAIALAMRDHDVLLVDGDEQGHAIAFTDLRISKRGAAGYTAVALHGAAIRSQVRQLSPKYDHVVIDVGGRDTGSLRAALVVSDCILIPAAPRSFDLWGVDTTSELVQEARELNDELRAIAVLNGADISGKDNAEAMAALGELAALEIAPSVARRKAFPNAAAAGMSVFEYSEPRHNELVTKARQDLLQLFEFIFDVRHINHNAAQTARKGLIQ